MSDWLREDSQRTDNALATIFIDVYGEDLRYVPKWLVWYGHRFNVDDDSKLVLKLGRQFAKEL
jgi:hypothetical protein